MQSFIRSVFLLALVLRPVPGSSQARPNALAFDAQAIARNLETPWSLAFAPDGRLFVTERPGRIRVIVRDSLAAEPWAALPVHESAARDIETGLMGLAIDPDFARSPRIYVCYTRAGGGGALSNEIAVLTERNGRGVRPTVLLGGIPAGSYHNGCRLKFGPDGKLYATTGDAAGSPREAGAAQSLASLAGKVLRLNRDGSVPADNPFPGSYVWSYGHRNPQGLAFQPRSGRLIATEHGTGGDGNNELNLIERGRNYGWPTVIGAARDPRSTPPIFVDANAPAGATFVTSGRYPALRGSLLVATLSAKRLLRFVLGSEDPPAVVRSDTLIDDRYGRLRDVVEGPDGFLYLATSNRDGRGKPTAEDDRVIRLRPSQAQQPAAVDGRPSPLTIGETFSIESTALAESRRINVYSPPGYADSQNLRLPVLYMPDGGIGEDFLHVAGLIQVSVSNGTMRPFLLVGIENTQRRRDLTGPTQSPEDRKIAPRVGESAAFRRFIRSELMPLIRARYRTTGETGIVGESLAGLFVVETFFLEPDLFDTYIAFDPSLWWNNRQLVNGAADRLGAGRYRQKTLYLASSDQRDLAELTGRLADLLKERADAGLAWHYDAMPGETHATIYHPAALTAFRRVFKPGPQAPEVAVTGPTIIAFWMVPASDSVLEADPGVASALDEQQYWWSETRPLLESQGIAARDQPGRRFVVREPARRWTFAAEPDSGATGYLLVEPGRQPRALYGRQFPDELLAAARQTFSTLQPRLAFASKRDGNWEIYVIDADGRRRTRLTTHPAQDRFPVWSPDGRRIAFGSQRGGGWELWVMRSDGASPVRLASDIVAKGRRSWSPDGTRIAFESDRDGNREIYTVQADGTGLTRLTDSPAEDYGPSWSPDGTRIAFTSSRDGNREIYVMRADGADPTRITNHPAADANPAWSPDGRRIAFASSRAGNPDIHVMDADGGHHARLTVDPADDDLPRWSPDGTRIAFQSVRGKNYDIELVGVDGGPRTQIAASPEYDGLFAWSSDGTRISFISSRDGQEALYALRLGAARPTRLAAEMSLDPDWSP